MKKTLVEKYVEDPFHMRLFQQERAIYEATELLESVMRETGVTRTELARRLGKTKGWVTQLLDEEANKTIRTVADAFAVLGREYCSFQRPIRVGRRATNKVQSVEPGAARGPRAAIGLYDLSTKSFKVTESTPATSEEISIEMAL